MRKKIGIISLGWLGESLAAFLKNADQTTWGTVSSKEKAEILAEKGIEALIWRSEEGISDKLKESLKITDILIFNLPPSVFKTGTYAEGLSQFIPIVNEKAKVIFTSSTGVYPPGLLDAKEDYVFKADEKNKLKNAEEALQGAYGARLTILRLAGLIGENRHPVYYLAKKEINGEPEKPVNLIHRNDILKVIQKIILKDNFGTIYNLCHPEHPSRKEYYSQKSEQFNLPKIHFTEEAGNTKYKIVNCNKVIDELEYSQFEAI